MDLSKYKSFIFDCDGVLLNSNYLKSNAFYSTVLQFGDQYANALLTYHKSNGGVSRYLKFKYFIDQILPAELTINLDKDILLKSLLSNYADHVKAELQTCDVVKGLSNLRCKYPDSRWHVVSGGDQQELVSLFTVRGLTHLFDGQIFGSPDDKQVILHREILSRNIIFPAVFFGDSRYDYTSANAFGIDFVFVSDWTDVVDWHNFVTQFGLTSVRSIQYL